MSSITWRYLRCLLVFPLQYNLPGVFSTNPVDAVNGSLWTLQHEVRLYGAIALLGVLSILRPRLMFALVLTLLAIRIYGIIYTPDAKTVVLGERWGKLELAIRLASQFALGAFFYLIKDRVPLNKEIFFIAILSIAALIHWQGVATPILFDILFSYAVIYVGFVKLPLLPAASKFGDFSYGIYLYAFPMQQLSIHLFGKGADFTLFLISSGALTLLCAVLSWHFIEKPALARKQ